MLTDDRVIAALALAIEMERAVKQQVNAEREPARQRQVLAIFRHAHALKLALEDWQDGQQ